MTAVIPQLRTRPPTGIVHHPLLLVEGEEKAGKTWAAALLSKSPRVGATYWIDLGEGCADEYGAIPGVKYEVVVHDGTWADIFGQVLAVKAEATRANAAGEPPTVLVIDTISNEWDGLKDWVSDRARHQPGNQKRLSKNPDAEVVITGNLWNDAFARHHKLMTQLLTFPGVVILTARGKEVAEIKDGQPVEGRRTWRVEGHKSLGYDATLWLRMFRDGDPLVVGARSVHAGIRPGRDEAQPVEGEHDNLLEWLIFDALRYDPATATTRDIKNTTGGELTEEERAQEDEEQDTGRGYSRPRSIPRQQPQRPASTGPSPALVQFCVEAAAADVTTLSDMRAGLTPARLAAPATNAVPRNLADIAQEAGIHVTGSEVTVEQWLDICHDYGVQEACTLAQALQQATQRTPEAAA